MNPARFHHQHALGITRRELLQVGYSGLLGIGLPSLLAHQARAKERKRVHPAQGSTADSVIFIFLTGAPSHIDTFDMKPNAPAEIRGAFAPIATAASGVMVCEHLPLL
ncbi:MAG TPA: DUF1501 domain-containing protein, partial [Isosphaeraceae bacterium]|nr:DUF1501 domain-containing protein [Isosphaeraceae bacterium]